VPKALETLAPAPPQLADGNTQAKRLPQDQFVRRPLTTEKPKDIPIQLGVEEGHGIWNIGLATGQVRNPFYRNACPPPTFSPPQHLNPNNGRSSSILVDTTKQNKKKNKKILKDGESNEQQNTLKILIRSKVSRY